MRATPRCNSDGTTYDGIAPFTTPGDLSTPNPAYFDRAADMIAIAAKHHQVVLLDPAETGSWLSVLEANGVDKARAYGKFLGNRFKDMPNIIWMSGNDFQSWSGFVCSMRWCECGRQRRSRHRPQSHPDDRAELSGQ